MAKNEAESLSSNLIAYERHTSREHSVWYRSTLFTFLAEGKDTNGQMSVIELAPKRGLEPGPHTHTKEDEAYYVLEGEVIFYVGDQEFPTSAGGFVFLPRGVQHYFHIQTPEARMIMMLMPSGFENFFHALALPIESDDLQNARQTNPDIAEQRNPLGDQYGIILPESEL